MNRTRNTRSNLISFLLATLVANGAWAQCDPTVPSFPVNLTSSPSATFMSPSVQRLDHCCGAVSPDECIEFIVTLHPQAQGIQFDICAGAMPSGAMFYQVNCAMPTPVGTPLCLNGAGPHVITFCKPGNNFNQYCITSIPAPSAGPALSVSDGCSALLTSSGFAPGSTTWTSIAPGPTGTYDAALSCPTCPNTDVTGINGFPAFVDYMICGNALSPCSTAVFCDTVRVNFFPGLTVAIAPTQPVLCYGVPSLPLTVSASGGAPPLSYLWSTGATTTTIQAGPGTYSVQVSDGTDCPAGSATITVQQYTQAIQALAGGDLVICDGNNTVPLSGQVIAASGGQWSGGAGQFLPSATDLNATYVATPAEISAGSVALTLTTTGNGPCPGDQDAVTLSFSPGFATLGITSTNITCSGAGNGTASVTGLSAGMTVAWSDPLQQTTSTATNLGPGAVSATVTDALGCDTTLSVTVLQPAALTVAQLNVIDASCAGLNNGNITASVSGGTPPYAYQWSGIPGTTTSITAGAGTYSVTVTDANGCQSLAASGTINAPAAPQAFAGPDLLVCTGDLPLTVQGSMTNAASGNWSGGMGSFLVNGTTGIYMPTATELNIGFVDLVFTAFSGTACPNDQDTVHITLPDSFQGALITTSPGCSGSNSGSAFYSPTSPGLTYLWSTSPPQTTPFINGLASGSYTLTVSDAFGCDTTMTAVITAPPALVANNITVAPPSCSGGSNGSATVNITGGTPGYTCQWSANTGNQTTAMAANLGVGTYVVVVVDAAGCIAQGSVTITAPPPITLTAQVPATACINAPVMLNAQAGGGQGNYQIQWTGIGFGSPLTYSFPASQTVEVTVTDGAGCPGPTLTFPLTVLNLNTATLVPYGGGIYCPGSTASIGAAVNNYPGPVTMTWPELGVTGPGPFNVAVTGDMTYTVIASNSCGQSLTSTVVIQLEVPPAISLPALIAEGCEPLSVTMPDTLTSEPVTYLWDFGDGSTGGGAGATHTYTGAGTYVVSLTVTTPNGCTADAANTGLVIVHANPIGDFTASPWSTTYDAPEIDFSATGSAGVITFDWTFGDGGIGTGTSPSHTYTDIGNFPVELLLTDANGCTALVTHEVEILPIYDIEIPNAFSPDPNGGGGVYDPGDLGNDVFFPFVQFVKDFRMRIYNRWGELVFESTDVTIGWDGHYRGQLSQQDVYIYQLWIRFVDDNEIERTGDLTLFR